MAHEDDVERVWTLMEKIGLCMLSTRQGEDIHARPMAAHVARSENAIYFLADAASPKEAEIASNPHVGLAFADAGSQKYVSVSGQATLSNDRAKIKELWSTWAKAWWDSAEDPAIRLLKVTPKDAQYWDSPGRVMSYVKMLAAAVTESRPAMGDSVKLRL